MKNKISLVVVLFIATLFMTLVKAQNSPGTPSLKMVELGFQYMPTFYTLDFNASDGGVIKGSVTMSQGFGAMLGLNFSPHVGVQGEIDYYKATQRYRDANVDRDVNIKYLDIPLLLSLNTSKTAGVNLNVVAGPQFGINAGSNISSSGSNGSETIHATVAAKKGDVGAAYGAGLEFALGQAHNVRFDLGYRGFYGFVKMDARKSGADTYNVIVSANRKTNAAYARLTFLF